MNLIAGDRLHCLELATGDDDIEKRHVVSPLGLKIGRTAPADIVLADSEASRSHCLVALKDDEFYVSDLNSTNGTFIDGTFGDTVNTAAGTNAFSPDFCNGQTGGDSFAKIKHSFATTNTANAFTEVNDNKMKFGYQLGGGTEVMVTDKVSLGIEYLYNHYQDGEYFVNAGPGTAAATSPFLLTSGATNMRPAEDNLDFHSLRATVSFQF